MYPECIIKLNELILTEENKYYTFSLVYGIWEKQTSKVNETRWGGDDTWERWSKWVNVIKRNKLPVVPVVILEDVMYIMMIIVKIQSHHKKYN